MQHAAPAVLNHRWFTSGFTQVTSKMCVSEDRTEAVLTSQNNNNEDAAGLLDLDVNRKCYFLSYFMLHVFLSTRVHTVPTGFSETSSCVQWVMDTDVKIKMCRF